MELMRKIVRKVKEGLLQEMYYELLWIYRYGLKYKGAIAWYLFLGMFGTVMSLGGSILSKHIIDAVTGQDTSVILYIAVCYVLMRLFNIATGAWTGYISAKIQVRVDQEIRADVYDRIMDANWEAMSEYHSGDLLNRVDHDVSSVSASVIGWVPEFITRMVQFAGTFVVICYYDATLALLALLSAPVTILMSGSLMRKMRLYNQKIREAGSEVTAFHKESFSNIQMIKSFGLMEQYGEKFREIQAKQRQVKLDHAGFTAKTSALMSLVGTVVSILCFGWSVHRLWSGHITYGTMTLFLQLAGTLTASFSSLVYMIPKAVGAATAAGRLMAVTELPKEVHEQKEEVEELLNRREGIVVEAERIRFSYGTGNVVLDQADFKANPGEIVALVGASGSGKTTMLRILLGIVRVKEGLLQIKSMDDSIRVRPNAASRCLFAYVPQVNMMFAGTIADNLRMMKPDATDEELNEVLRIACAYDFVHAIPTGLYSRMKENGTGFSQGQIQRLSIARALLSDAPVLLLDEATSALDIKTERNVLKNIINCEQHRTCIVTTHRPSVLASCDRIYRIADSRMHVITLEDSVELFAEN